MHNYDVTAILEQKGVQATTVRTTLLEIFLEWQEALSLQQIRSRMPGSYNRVTIYRTLELFLEKGLIHILPSTSAVMRYGLLKNYKGQHYHQHLHFLCDSCGRAICLGDIPVPRFTLPVGFTVEGTEVVITGKCNNCTGTTR